MSWIELTIVYIVDSFSKSKDLKKDIEMPGSFPILVEETFPLPGRKVQTDPFRCPS